MEYEFLDKVENNTTSQTYSEKHKNGEGRVRDLAWWPGDSRRLSKSLQQADEPYEDGQMMDRDQDQENELAMASIGEITSNMRMKKNRCCFLEYEGKVVHVSVLCKGICFLEKFPKCN